MDTMKLNLILLLTFFLALLVVYCSSDDLKVKGNGNSGVEPRSPLTSKNTSSSSENSSKTVPVIKDEDQVEGSKKSTQNNHSRNNSGSQQESREVVKVPKTFKDDSGKELQVKDGEKKEPLIKENNQGEECDSSKMCVVENKLVACLRVPGNDQDLSLLIQNKGSGSLSVAIAAPSFVKLEKTKIELQKKDEKKVVKVSIIAGGADNFITLTAGNSNCALDFRDLVTQNSRKETKNPLTSTYTNLLTQKSSITIVVLAALMLIMASGCMWVRFRRRHIPNGKYTYNRLDMELPTSGGGKTETDINAGWDDSWSDNWDDEEANKTPSKPVTPNLSAQGLASRRLSKEGWKD